MTRRIVRTLKYMEPFKLADGAGFQTVVELDSGRHYLISEVHRSRIDEVMVFPCGPDGRVTDWSEVYGERESTTASAIGSLHLWNIDYARRS